MTADVRTRVVPDFDATDPIGLAVTQCWLDVSNAGGAVGFPSIPVSGVEVRTATQRLARDVAAGAVVVLVAESAGTVVGWVVASQWVVHRQALGDGRTAPKST